MAQVTRRDFVRYCSVTAGAIGLSAADVFNLDYVLAKPTGPRVLWLQGAGCTGCSVSFLNRVSNQDPRTAADVLINWVNLSYHPNLMASAGEAAAQQLNDAYVKGGYILAIEGAVPTAMGGATCWAYSKAGQDVTFQRAVKDLSAKASSILAIGTCAAWGGIPASGGNPTAVRGVGAFTRKPAINIAGCPPHPDWIAWAIVQLCLKKKIARDASGRPKALFGRTVHDACPLHETEEAGTFGVPGRCLEELGCRGPSTRAGCPGTKWNNAQSWCIGAGAPCLGCTESSFPGAKSFYAGEDGED